jgi:cobalamin synthase
VNAQWRLFLAALRFVIPGPRADSGDLEPREASRFVPLAGICVGLLGGFVYWLAAQVWPASVALILSLFATALATGEMQQPGAAWVFALLIKYNALMALSAANVPFPLPDDVALGLIMVTGHAASRALVVSVMGSRPRVAAMDLSIALCLGLAPAAFLGIPGLVGLAAAIATRLILTAFVLPRLPVDPRARTGVTQQFTEIGLYLGALAAWRYI